MSGIAKIWKRVSPFVRITVGVVLLVWLFQRIELAELLATVRKARDHWGWLAAGLMFSFLGISACAVRWKYVLEVQGINFTNWQVFLILFIGQFFNAFMLGACGGDVMRAYYAAKNSSCKKTEAAATIFIDRAVGLFTMILFCCLVIPFRISIFLDHTGPRQAGVLMLVFMAVSLLGLFFLFEKNVFEHFAIFRRLENMPKLGAVIRRSYDALYMYRSHHRILGIAMVLSLASLFMLTLACYCFGRTLSIEVPLSDYFVLFPIINVLSAVPLTPGSLGVREHLFVSLFGSVFVGPLQAALMSLLFYAGGLFWSLFGGLLYVFSSFSKEGMPHVSQDDWLGDPRK